MQPYATNWNKTSIFQKMWAEAQDPKSDHPYLIKKNIAPNGIGQTGDNLIIPVFLGKEITGIQTIANDGEKKFVAGSKINGGYYDINPELPKDTIYILEGFAKAVSVCDATFKSTFCAFSAGNLVKCALYLRSIYPDAEIIIGADGDPNGIKFAQDAARAIGGLVAYAPEGKDFSDVSILDYEPKEPPVKIEIVREIKDYSSYDETFDKETIEDMLAAISPDISYHEWIEIGMALKAGGSGLGVWDEWSKGSTKYKKNGCYDHWQSFKGGAITIGTLVHHAQLNGWQRKYEVVSHKKMASVDMASIIENAKKKIEASINPKSKPVLDNLRFDGLIDETVKWITKSAQYEQPLLATLNVISVMGAIFGRRFASPLNTRTNIYLVGVGKTGGGKDYSRKLLVNLAKESGLLKYIGDNAIRSDSGVVKSLTKQISQVMMIDEFGMFLKAIKDPKSPGHIKAAASLIIQLYSTSSSIYKHGTYATEKMESMELDSPNLCIYGTTTEEAYVQALSRDGLKNGELNRFIVLPTGDIPPPKHNPDSQTMPPELVEKWRVLAPDSNDRGLANITNNPAFGEVIETVEWGETWEEMCSLLNFQYDKRDEPLWARYRENIIKIAMIYCLSEGKRTLESRHIEPAKMLVEASILYMDNLARRHMAETQWEGTYNEMLEVIGQAGGNIKRATLQQKMKKMRPKDFKDLLGQMHETEVVNVYSEKPEEGAGRPTVYVKLL